MQHLDEGTIHSWLDGALSAEEAARVEAHVKECAQCQAAVAEARGFIAASSRILTALDNAPRGVIPATAPKRRIDPMVWRIAASVLVVALGSVLVIRERGSNGKTYETTESPDTVSTFAPPVRVLANQKAGGERREAGGGASGKREAGSGGQTAATASPTRVVAPSPTSVAGGNARLRQDLNKAAAAPQAAEQNAPRRLEATAGRAATSGVVSMDAMADEQPLRGVRKPGALGERLTVYELAPGDTVMLTEQVKALSEVVVTGVGVSRARPIAAAAQPPEAKHAAKLAPTQDAQRSAQAPAPLPPAPAAAFSFTQTPDGIATLSWKDPVSGNVMRLSGRHTRAELEEIKHKIDRERAAAADSVKKD